MGIINRLLLLPYTLCIIALTIAVVAALVILLLGAGALLPEETARAIHLISS